MSQGFVFNTGKLSLVYADSANLDAFGRLRVGLPTYAFDSQLTYDLAPLLYQQVTAQSGATVTYDSTNRMALMAFSSTPTGGKAFMQSYEHFRYQPGRSQELFMSFNLGAAVANVVKFAGLSDGTNGVELQLNGSTTQIVIYSGTGNGNQTVTQANWNLDKMDGTGSSGLTLDLTKIQILTVDFQALYSGRVRVGFDIGGSVIYVHQFLHANAISTPFVQTANLPIRCGMTCSGTVTATMNFICSSVITGGGDLEPTGFGFSAEGTVTASSGARTHLISIRPKTTFNSGANRSKCVLDQLAVIVTGANPVLWELCLGQAITGASYADVNTTYSAFEFSGGTISGSPGVVIESGYSAGSSNQVQSTPISRQIANRYPITLDQSGAVRALGTVSLIVTGLGGTSATRMVVNWHEIR